MTASDALALMPMLITAYAGVILMMLVAFWPSQRLAFSATLLILAAAIGSIFVALPHTPRTVTPLIQIDSFALYFTGLILVGAFLVTLLCPGYLHNHEKRGEALYLLLIMSVLGMLTLASSAHFVSFFLGLEILSVSLYGLIGYTRRYKKSLEAAMKYLILAATASAFLLFGIALVYSETGTMAFRLLAPMLAAGDISTTSYFGLALILVGVGFKLALAPFHMWSPDVYQGAPAPVTALIATGSKGAVFALLLRLFVSAKLNENPAIFLTISVIAIATMFVGNLLALLQNNVKRLLAYSSIAHMGYLLIPLLAARPDGASSIAFYLTAYFATNIAAFGVISVLSSSRAWGDADSIEDYRGLSHRNPLIAVTLTLALLSLTGIPLTAGFFAKFYIFSAAARTGLWALLIVGVINSGMSAFYYLKLVIAMFSQPSGEVEPLPAIDNPAKLALTVSIGLIVFFGVYPAPLIRLAEAVTRLL